MALYADWVLPRILNLAMGMRFISDERKKCLAGVTGTVLEVGFGSGHNLPFYPASVQGLVAVDPSTESAKLARQRIARAPFPVTYVALDGENIDAPDASFDSVVSTFTLCTIPDPAAVLRQVLRVLKPEGKFFLVEHGRSPDPKVQRWQNRMNGVQKALFGGCHLNRDIEQLVRDAGFTFDEIEKYTPSGQPRMSAFLTRGVARPANA